MCKTVNNILNCKAFSTDANKLTTDGSHTCDIAFIASKLNEDFSDLFKTLAEAFGDSDISLDYLGQPTHKLFQFELVTEKFVSNLLLPWKNSSPGYDELPIQICKKKNFNLFGSLITKTCKDSILVDEFPK